MKIPSSIRFLRFYAVVFLFLQSLATAFSQSPASIAGATFDLQVSGGVYPFGSTGRYLLLFRGDSKRVSYNVSVPGGDDSVGPYIWDRTEYYRGRLGFLNFTGGIFTFLTTNSGSFSMGIEGRPETQYGNFKEYTGTAPTTLAQKVIQVDGPSGNLAFGGAAPYKIVTTSPSTYFVQNSAGTVVHSGDYSYVRTNRASGVFKFQDSVHAAGFLVLTFETNNVGLSLVRKSTNQFQVGAFVISDAQPPAFTLHPTSRSVLVGTPTTFSAAVTGTGPFTYQWYKENNAIGGQTGTSFTIPSVQLWDAGSYRVVATSPAGSVSSVSATLTPVCHYSISRSSVAVDFRGGTRNITVFAAGTCSWTASSGNDWITITSATAGQGNSPLSFMVDANQSDTPRFGSLQIAGKTLVVAQGPRFALPDIAGKTFRLNFSESPGDNGLLIMGSGTNRLMEFVPFDTNNAAGTLDYNYTVLSSSNAVINAVTQGISLRYDTAKSGSFISTNLFYTEGVQSGTFAMSVSSPDFNLDGRGDLVLQGPTGGFAAWNLQNTNFLSVRLLRDGIAPNGGGRGFGAADFNQDGQSDIAIQDAAGRLLVWYMQGTNRVGGATLRGGAAAPGWRAFSVADVNSDGHPDILFQNNTDRRLSAWLFNGTTFLDGLSIRNGQPAAVGWRAVGASDLNSDGQTDILLQHDSGQISAWFLNGGGFVSVELLRDGIAAVKWKVMGTGDIDEDGSADILWQNDSNQAAAWLFNGKQFVRALYLRDGKPAGPGWKVVAPR